MSADTPTHEHVAALQRFADRRGRYWKATLRCMWFNGRDIDEPDGALLRQIRNQLGPEWLEDFKLPEPING